MASSSCKQWLTDREIGDVLTTLESAHECSDFIYLQSEGHNSSDSDENERADIDQPISEKKSAGSAFVSVAEWCVYTECSWL
jgi:hypothetical protein